MVLAKDKFLFFPWWKLNSSCDVPSLMEKYLIMCRVCIFKEKNIFKHANTFNKLLQNKWGPFVGLAWYIHSLGAWILLEFMKNAKEEKRKRREDRPKQYTCISRELTLKMW